MAARRRSVDRGADASVPADPAEPGAPDVGAAPAVHARIGRTVGAVGVAGAIVAAGLDPGAARAATGQDWPPFVLVAGLLLVGLVADEDGLFAAAGHALGRTAPGGAGLVAVVRFDPGSSREAALDSRMHA